MRSVFVPILVLLAGCTSTWERHQNELTDHERLGNYAAASEEARWMIDNAFRHGPVSERTTRAEARRYLRLARLEARAGDTDAAVVALRRALMADPESAADVHREVSELPLEGTERRLVQEEFSWNLAALAPQKDLSENADAGRNSGQIECWSYTAKEVRIRQKRSVTRGGRTEHRLTYDAREWQFDADSKRWVPAGDWRDEAGTEVEYADSPPKPRYRALNAAERQFYVDGRVPPCHRSSWDGPYDATRQRVFVAAKLPPN